MFLKPTLSFARLGTVLRIHGNANLTQFVHYFGFFEPGPVIDESFSTGHCGRGPQLDPRSARGTAGTILASAHRSVLRRQRLQLKQLAQFRLYQRQKLQKIKQTKPLTCKSKELIQNELKLVATLHIIHWSIWSAGIQRSGPQHSGWSWAGETGLQRAVRYNRWFCWGSTWSPWPASEPQRPSAGNRAVFVFVFNCSDLFPILRFETRLGAIHEFHFCYWLLLYFCYIPMNMNHNCLLTFYNYNQVLCCECQIEASHRGGQAAGAERWGTRSSGFGLKTHGAVLCRWTADTSPCTPKRRLMCISLYNIDLYVACIYVYLVFRKIFMYAIGTSGVSYHLQESSPCWLMFYFIVLDQDLEIATQTARSHHLKKCRLKKVTYYHLGILPYESIQTAHTSLLCPVSCSCMQTDANSQVLKKELQCPR